MYKQMAESLSYRSNTPSAPRNLVRSVNIVRQLRRILTGDGHNSHQRHKFLCPHCVAYLINPRSRLQQRGLSCVPVRLFALFLSLNLFVCKSLEFCRGQCNVNSNDHSDTALEAYFKAQDSHTQLLLYAVARESL